MGLLKKITSRILTGKAADSEARDKQELLRKCYFEVMEQRRVLSADPVIAAVTYFEADTGQDASPDQFEVTFEGGADTTQLTQFTINGDQDQSGSVTTGDMIFDINDQLPGTGGNFDFEFDAANSTGVEEGDVGDVSVSSDGLSLIVNVSNFEAGDVFAFTIDVDEIEGRRLDTIASGVEFEGTFFQAQFVDENFTFNDKDFSFDTVLNEGFEQTQFDGVFYDEYDALFTEAESVSGGEFDLPVDNETGEENRTDGAIDAYDLEAKPITIEGNVYHDEDLDCVHDEDEDGISGVQIDLQRLNLETGEYETVATTTTDASGGYKFGEELDIKPGTFRLVEIQPDGFLNVGESAGSEGGLATENVISEIEIPLGGTAATDYDFKEVRPASIQGNVWHDENNDGVFDPNEQGIANVLIQVTRVGAKDGVTSDVFADTEPMFVRTDANGHYSVDQLPPGIYEVIEINNYPADEVDPLAAFIDGKDSVGNVAGTTVGTQANDRFTQIELCADDDGVEYNFGEVRPASIGGNVSVVTPGSDPNNPNDPLRDPIEGVTIELYDADGSLLATTLTDANGDYEFTGLAPGDYSVVEVQPDGFLDASDHLGNIDGENRGDDSQNDRFTNITLNSGDAGTDYDFCEFLPASISGKVLAITPGSDPNDPNDPLRDPIPGVTIELYDADGNLVATTVTDANGCYEFTGLAPGDYSVFEVQPDGFIDASDHLGNVDGETRGDDSQNDRFTNITLNSGDVGTNFDFCEFIPASISGTVHVDTDGDCVYEEGVDRLLGGVTMELLDADGNVIATTITDAQGNYSFDGLEPGEYAVRQIQPDGLFSGGQFAGSNGGSAIENLLTSVFVGSGEQATNYNFCEFEPSSISGTVHVDANGDCVFQEGVDRLLGGVTIELLNADGNVIATTITDAQGNYSFEGLEAGEYGVREIQPDGLFTGGQFAGSNGGDVSENLLTTILVGVGDQATNYDFCEIGPASISGTVHVDANGDCVYEEGVDRLLGGVTMELLDSDGNVVATTVTDAQGNYSFEDLAPGDYAIRQVQPEGLFSGGQFAGSNGGIASDNLLTFISVDAGDQATNYDFCEVEPSTISGRVHVDVNGDCVYQEGTDEVLAGVTMELLDSDGNVVATTVTDAEGNYTFEGLEQGEYAIRQIQPDGFFSGGEFAGSNGGDATENLLQTILIGPGDQAVNYDFCEHLPAEIHGRVFEDGPAIESEDGLAFEGYRALSDGIYNANTDTPIAGVTLELYFFITDDSLEPTAVTIADVLPEFYTNLGSDPNTAITAVTDSDGQYWFQGLEAGNYIVLEQQPDGFVDANDTVGDTTGFVFNEIDETAAAPQSLSIFSTTQLLDSISAIQVDAGGISQFNNFSEVTFVAAPEPPPSQLPPPVPSQPQTPGNPVTPGAGLTGFPGLLGSQGIAQTVLGGNTRGLFDGNGEAGGDFAEYTWHLSVINGGQPRSIGETDLADNQGGYLESNDWRRFDMNDAVWSFTTTNENSGIVSETGDQSRFGVIGGTPLAGDFDGDGMDEIAMFKDGYWMIDINHNGQWDEGDLMARLGDALDRPVVGDWDGDGKDDIGIYGPIWARDMEAIDREPGLPNPDNDQYTDPKNVPPVVDEAAEGARVMRLSVNGVDRADVIDHVFGTGTEEQTPVTGDWNGNGIRSIGTFEAGRWNLDVDGDGRFTSADVEAKFGQTGDIPVVGDFDGDGVEEIAIYRAGTWMIDSNNNNELDATDRTFQMGTAADTPVVGDWDGDGVDEPALYRESQSNEVL